MVYICHVYCVFSIVYVAISATATVNLFQKSAGPFNPRQWDAVNDLLFCLMLATLHKQLANFP